MAPETTLWLIGYYGEAVYVKGLLDWIGVQTDFLQMGAYKSGAEMFTRTGPSAPADENLNWLFDSLYQNTVNTIAESRGMTAEQVQGLIDGGPYFAEKAKKAGLIRRGQDARAVRRRRQGRRRVRARRGRVGQQPLRPQRQAADQSRQSIRVSCDDVRAAAGQDAGQARRRGGVRGRDDRARVCPAQPVRARGVRPQRQHPPRGWTRR